MALLDGPFTLPMFPLGSVVWPGDTVPLRVFEERYRRLVLDCLGDPGPAFGTVLIARGNEVGGGDERNEVGTIVSIAVVRPTGQGTFAVGGVGVARVRVRSWLDDTPYPLAELQLFPDPPVLDPTVTRATLSRLVDRATEIRSLVTHGERAHPVAPLGDDEDVGEASFRVAGSIPLGPADRYAVLAAADVDTRLAETARAFDDVEAALRFGQQQ